MALTKTVKVLDIDPVYASDGSSDYLKVRVQIKIDEDGKLLVAKEYNKKASLSPAQKTALANFLNNLTLEDIPNAAGFA